MKRHTAVIGTALVLAGVLALVPERGSDEAVQTESITRGAGAPVLALPDEQERRGTDPRVPRGDREALGVPGVSHDQHLQAIAAQLQQTAASVVPAAQGRVRPVRPPDTIAVRWWRAEDEPHAMWVQWADGGRCEWEMGAGEREGVVRCARPADTNNHTVELPHVGALTRLEVGP